MKSRWWVGALTTITTMVVCLVALGGYGHHRFGSAENALAYLSGVRLRIEPASAHHGNVALGESRTTAFTLTNLTGRPMRVFGSKITCNCTSVDDVPDVIPMIRPRTMKLTFHPSDSDLGHQVEGSLVLFVDDPRVRQVALTFMANVVSRPSRQ